MELILAREGRLESQAWCHTHSPSARYERLEEQLNDLTELHQNEMSNLKQELASMEEKVAYQSYERARDIQVYPGTLLEEAPGVLAAGSSQRVRLYHVGDGGHRLLHQLGQTDTWVKRVVRGEVDGDKSGTAGRVCTVQRQADWRGLPVPQLCDGSRAHE